LKQLLAKAQRKFTLLAKGENPCQATEHNGNDLNIESFWMVRRITPHRRDFLSREKLSGSGTEPGVNSSDGFPDIGQQ